MKLNLSHNTQTILHVFVFQFAAAVENIALSSEAQFL